MTKSYNPYRNPFPRWYHLSRYRKQLVHPLERLAMEPYFKQKNEYGYHHDLGMMDVLFDNFGVLISEQFEDAELRRQYLTELPKLMLYWWQAAQRQIIQKKPFWGVNFNASSRDANAGEPRSLLRFVADDDLADGNASVFSLDDGSADSDSYTSKRRLFEDGRLVLPITDDQFAVVNFKNKFVYDDWNADELFPVTYRPNTALNETLGECLSFRGGVLLPEDMSKTVDAIRILHPRHCTPDLPLRVGLDRKDFELYQRLWRNQSSLPSCVSFALCTALEILVRRCCSSGQKVRFSPAWVHCMSGDVGNQGRRLGTAVEAIRYSLPCHEDAYPYDPIALGNWRNTGVDWESPQMAASSRDLTARFGEPQIRKLDVTDISVIKTHLAAGWLIIVSTSLTEDFWEHAILNNPSGLTFAPLKGQKRMPTGHAWLLTGYDHVDGNQRWKYQGRFLALNAWNINRTLGKGIVTLPFAMLLTEGIEAFAIRLNS